MQTQTSPGPSIRGWDPSSRSVNQNGRLQAGFANQSKSISLWPHDQIAPMDPLKHAWPDLGSPGSSPAPARAPASSFEGLSAGRPIPAPGTASKAGFQTLWATPTEAPVVVPASSEPDGEGLASQGISGANASEPKAASWPAALQAARQEGYEQAREEFQARLAEQEHRLAERLAISLERTINELREHDRESVARTALERSQTLAKLLLGDWVLLPTPAWENLLQVLLRSLPPQIEELSLHVHPSDLPCAQEALKLFLQKQPLHPKVHLSADTELLPGEAQARHEQGGSEASFPMLAEQILQAAFPNMRNRRNEPRA